MSGGLPVMRVLGSAALMVAMGVSTAHAQKAAGDVPLDTFRPAMDSRGDLTVNAAPVLGPKDLSFGLGPLVWRHRSPNLRGRGHTSEGGEPGAATPIARSRRRAR